MNATVTLPLSEIDTLRNDLQKAVDRVKELESTQKKIKVEIREEYHAFQTDFRGSIPIVVPYTAIREHPHQYVNMEDVIDPIRQEEKLKVDEEIRNKDKTIRDLTDQYEKLRLAYNEKIKQLKEQYEEKIKILEEKKIDQSKDNKIKELLEKLYEKDLLIDKIEIISFFLGM